MKINWMCLMVWLHRVVNALYGWLPAGSIEKHPVKSPLRSCYTGDSCLPMSRWAPNFDPYCGAVEARLARRPRLPGDRPASNWPRTMGGRWSGTLPMDGSPSHPRAEKGGEVECQVQGWRRKVGLIRSIYQSINISFIKKGTLQRTSKYSYSCTWSWLIC